jgi:hypothetical protein
MDVKQKDNSLQKKAKDDEKEINAHFDGETLSNCSDYSTWLYLNLNSTNSNAPTNDRVRIVNTEDLKDLENQKDDLIVIPRLNFQKIDLYRQFPKENSKDEEIQKKLKDVFGDTFQADSNRKKKVELKKGATKDATEHSPAKQQAKSRHQDQVRRVQSKPAGAAEEPPLKKEKKSRLVWYYAVLILGLCSSLMEFLCVVQAFDSLSAFLDTICQRIAVFGAGGMIFCTFSCMLVFHFTLIPGLSIFVALMATRVGNFLSSFFLVYFAEAIIQNATFHIAKRLKCSRQLAGLIRFGPASQVSGRLLGSSAMYPVVLFNAFFPKLFVASYAGLQLKRSGLWLTYLNLNVLIGAVLSSMLPISKNESLAYLKSTQSLQTTGLFPLLFFLFHLVRFLFVWIAFFLVTYRSHAAASPTAIHPSPGDNNADESELNVIRKE